ncbi:MAG: LysM peptidoglycan-binding domain-containing protein [Anaerolineae bacterium]|nr:LysM peptidoglycan-binding domain-containing protein [Anaerolineae bacterium]
MNRVILPKPAKVITLILLLALVVGLVVPALGVSAQAGSAAAVNTGTLNIRSGPGVIFTIIGKLQYNEQITLIGKASSGTWVQIRTVGGNVGWVNSIHIRTYADFSLLPVTYDTSIIVPPQTVPPPGGGTVGGTVTYVVKTGDTLQTIARRYGTTWQAIAAANNLINANFIYAGQRLIIFGGGGTSGGPSTPPTQPSPGTYVVQAGDTLAIIAAKFGTTWQAIAAANNLANANNIYTGQRLTIPSAPARQPQSYVVKQGDTLFSIAMRYGTTVQVIQTANKLANPNAIYAGQTLTIP